MVPKVPSRETGPDGKGQLPWDMLCQAKLRAMESQPLRDILWSAGSSRMHIQVISPEWKFLFWESTHNFSN